MLSGIQLCFFLNFKDSYLKTYEGNWKDDSRVFVDITGSDPKHLVDVLRSHHRLKWGRRVKSDQIKSYQDIFHNACHDLDYHNMIISSQSVLVFQTGVTRKLHRLIPTLNCTKLSQYYANCGQSCNQCKRCHLLCKLTNTTRCSVQIVPN